MAQLWWRGQPDTGPLYLGNKIVAWLSTYFVRWACVHFTLAVFYIGLFNNLSLTVVFLFHSFIGPKFSGYHCMMTKPGPLDTKIQKYTINTCNSLNSRFEAKFDFFHFVSRKCSFWPWKNDKLKQLVFIKYIRET